MSLISSHASEDEVACWTSAEQVLASEHVIHTEQIEILSMASGHLNIEPFIVPNLDCRAIGYMVHHCCVKGPISGWDPEVARHLVQDGADTCVALNCWNLTTEKVDVVEPELKWNPDPCARAEELLCCLAQRTKIGVERNWSFEDASGSVAYISEKKLCEMIDHAQNECDRMCGRNSRSATFRCGGYACN